MVFVPGFTQTARSWDHVVERLPADVEPNALDIPAGADFVTTARTLGDAGGLGTYVGYSMGGRLCLRLALDRPQLVERLVLVSASPGIADPEEHAARQVSDEHLACEIERDGVDAFLLRWLAQPLFATLSVEDADLEDRATHSAAALAATLRTFGTGTQEPMWHRLAELQMPVDLVVGVLDSKFAGIARQMAPIIGTNARVLEIEDAGHAVHLERPDAFVHALTS